MTGSNLNKPVPGRPDINCTTDQECWTHRRHARRVYVKATNTPSSSLARAQLTHVQQLLESVHASACPRRLSSKHLRTHTCSHPLSASLIHVPTQSHPAHSRVKPTVLGMRLQRRGRRCLGQDRSSRVFDPCTRRGPSLSKSTCHCSDRYPCCYMPNADTTLAVVVSFRHLAPTLGSPRELYVFAVIP